QFVQPTLLKAEIPKTEILKSSNAWSVALVVAATARQLPDRHENGVQSSRIARLNVPFVERIQFPIFGETPKTTPETGALPIHVNFGLFRGILSSFPTLTRIPPALLALSGLPVHLVSSRSARF